MSSNSSRFNRSEQRWLSHQSAGRFSEVPRFGMTAVVFSTVGDVSQTKKADIDMQVDYYEREARHILDQHRIMGGRAMLLEGVNMPNLQRVFEDVDISNVYIIGDGEFSYIYNDDASKDETANEKIQWYTIANLATHLKQGSIIKRTCGSFSRKALQVPFGSFTVADHRTLLGVLDDDFSPENYLDRGLLLTPEEKKIIELCGERALTLDYIHENFVPEPESLPTRRNAISEIYHSGRSILRMLTVDVIQDVTSEGSSEAAS